MSSENPRSRNTAGRVPAVGLALTGLLGLLLTSGCSSKATPPSKTEGGGNSTASGTSGATSTGSSGMDCGEVIRKASGMLQPTKLGIDTDRPQVADLLNQWMPECGQAENLPPVGQTATKYFTPLLTPKALAGMKETRFDSRDADHLRTCLMLKAIVEQVTANADNDRDRVSLLFDYVVRTMALTGDGDDALPLTPFELLVFGRGTAADRAWVFAELLRQLRIDAVILRPKSGEAKTGEAKSGQPSPGEADANAPFLVGVLLDEAEHAVLLFDPRLGWAIPSPKPKADNALDQTPATLAEWQAADAAAVEKLVAEEGGKYPLTPEALKSVRVELITHSDFSRPRMLAVQLALPAESSAIFFDPLDEVKDVAGGLSDRVVKFGGERWSAADVSLWPHPERSVSAFETPNDRQMQRLLVRREPLEAPVKPQVRGKVDKPELKFTPKRDLLKTRISHLLGNEPEAIRSYLIVRIAQNLPELEFVHEGQPVNLRPLVPPEIVRMQLRSGEFASFWVGVCQYENGDYAAAAQSFDDYLRKYPSGEWADHARGMQARAFTRTGKLAAASQALNSVSPADPQRDGHLLLQKRVREQREKATEK